MPRTHAPPLMPLPDPTHLHAHLDHCSAARSRLHHLHGLAEAVDGFVSPRFLSTLALLMAVCGLALWLGA